MVELLDSVHLDSVTVDDLDRGDDLFNNEGRLLAFFHHESLDLALKSEGAINTIENVDGSPEGAVVLRDDQLFILIVLEDPVSTDIF